MLRVGLIQNKRLEISLVCCVYINKTNIIN